MRETKPILPSKCLVADAADIGRAVRNSSRYPASSMCPSTSAGEEDIHGARERGERGARVRGGREGEGRQREGEIVSGRSV